MDKYIKRSCIAMSLQILISGCSTLEKSTAAGAASGAIVGGIAGSLLPGGPNSGPQNVIVGSLAGGAVGALTGALIHKTMEEKERLAYESGKASGKRNPETSYFSGSSDGHVPKWVSGKVDRHKIEGERRGNTFVEEHYEQTILEEGHWE